MLQIYNTLSKSKEIFKPIQKNKVTMYVCGITVYDYCHIGHARTMIAFDVIVRYLIHLGYQVKFVRNITDIDDKIIKRANETQTDYQEITARFIKVMHEDMKAMRLIEPNEEPRATEHIKDIIHIVEMLIEKGYAYVGDNKDVYYDVRRFKNYGQLSHRKLDDLRAGARIEVAKAKHDPLDFVLWKSAKPNEPSWNSPWGKGRPGWHIECSAMSSKCLAQHIDIHGGGMDLIFPHHENEIAQSEAATGEKLANYWIHTGYLQVNQEKMSKSLGNFLTIKEILEKYHSETLRLFMISSHYRSPLNYTEEGLKTSQQALERLYTALRSNEIDTTRKDDHSSFKQRFLDAMNDDFNTPEALSVLFDLAHEINKLRDENNVQPQDLIVLLKELGQVLGLLNENPETFLQGDIGKQEIARIEQLIDKRNAAREQKDWATADRIRDELLKDGITLEDASGKTIWRKI